MNIPSSIVQGDTISWIDNSTVDSMGNAIDSSVWTLTWYFSGPTTFSVVSSANGSGWATTLSSVQTAAMVDAVSPNYFWQARASKTGGVNVTIGTGVLQVIKDLSTANPGFDGRSQTEIDLAAVQTEIRARISGGLTIEYEIGNRRLRKESMTELLSLESSLKAQISKERRAQKIANGLGDPRNTFVRFT